jgi:hypothetical protein
MGKLILAVLLPYGPQVLGSDWLYRHRSILQKRWFFGGIFGRSNSINLSSSAHAPWTGIAADLVGAMGTIKRISSDMLQTKMREISDDINAIDAGDMDVGGKKDIMSLLVRARATYERQKHRSGDKITLDSKDEGYGMDNEAMIDQAVRDGSFLCFFSLRQLTV